MVQKIISGGQTGVDRAALDFALAAGIAHGGWCPRGRRATDGALPLKYLLTETESAGYRQRTKLNLRDSDATLVLNAGDLDGGTLQTVRLAEIAVKPLLLIPMDQLSLVAASHRISAWLSENTITVLNVAGPREEKRPGVYDRARTLLHTALVLLNAGELSTNTLAELGKSMERLIHERILSKGGVEPSPKAIKMAAGLLARRAARELKAGS